MKKILIAPDSFKGTFSSAEAGEIIKQVLSENLNDVSITVLPLADGGEGSLNCVKNLVNASVSNAECTDLFFNKITAPVAFFKKDYAFIESAHCVGLKTQKSQQNPCISTTFGIGEQILFAKNKGAKTIYIALGGSGTNDFGCGLACALGCEFFDAFGNSFIPVGNTLKKVEKINLTKLKNNLKDIKIIALCDVENPPYGENGATNIYAPQKGASKSDCVILESGVKSICDLIKKDFNLDLSNLKGGGSAGAMGAGLFAFCNAEIKSGINFMFELTNFEKNLMGYDLVITGEGSTDSQSLSCKVISGVISLANRNNVPTVILSGTVKDNVGEILKDKVVGIYSTVVNVTDFNLVKLYARQNLVNTAKTLSNDIKTAKIQI